MASCQASIVVGRNTKPIQVLFSSGSEVSYISEDAAAQLRFPVFIEAIPTVLKGTAGERVTCTHTALIDLDLQGFRHTVEVYIASSRLPYLVLGADWFHEHNPRMSFRAQTITITSDNGVQYTAQTTNVEKPIMPSVTVVRS